jgi:hypothetical protein
VAVTAAVVEVEDRAAAVGVADFAVVAAVVVAATRVVIAADMAATAAVTGVDMAAMAHTVADMVTEAMA